MKKFIYIIQHGKTKIYKIGIAINPHKRLKGLQNGNPFRLTLIVWAETESESIETYLHNKYKIRWIGGEWYMLRKKDIREIMKNFPLLKRHYNPSF